ncbi:MAG: glycosyltransferase [Deltaproteobacteria bacterium]
MKKAFLISYRFPPQGGGGVQRTLKYTKYLRDFGWEPVVHTARKPFWNVWDESLLDEIPQGVAIHQTRTFEIEKVEHGLRSLLSRLRGARKKAAPRVDEATANARKERGESARGGAAGGLKDLIYKHLLIPDQQIFWVLPALFAGRRLVRSEGAAVIHTSSPPNSLHLYGGLLAKLTGLPWVADFRDPWTDGPRRRRNYIGNPRREKIELAMERWVMRNADHIVVSAPPLRDRFLAKYDFLSEERISVVTNGYDIDDFREADKIEEALLPEKAFHLTGTGNIEQMFPAEHLFRAMAAACAKHEGLRRDLRVHLVGAKKGYYDSLLEELGLAERVTYEGWVPHARSIRYLQESDALLMCMIPHEGGGNEKLSGKGFEYLYMRKPFLCLTKPGLASELFSATELAKIVDPYDEEKIEQTLLELYERRDSPAAANDELIRRFDRRNLTGRLAGIFDSLTGAAASPPSAGAEVAA